MFKRISFNNQAHYGAGTGTAGDQPFTRINSWNPVLSNNSETVTFNIDSNLPGSTTFNYNWTGNTEIYTSATTGQFTTDSNGNFSLAASIDRSWNFNDTTNVDITVQIISTVGDDLLETSPNIIVRNAESIEATGGNITTLSGGVESLPIGYRIHEFSGANIAYNAEGFTITSLGLYPANIDIRYLVVGAGGDGGGSRTYQTGSPGGYTYWERQCGGGGGGGQVQENTESASAFSETNYKFQEYGNTDVIFRSLRSEVGGDGGYDGVEATSRTDAGAGGGAGQIDYPIISPAGGTSTNGGDGGAGVVATNTQQSNSKTAAGGGGGGVSTGGTNATKVNPDGIFGGSANGGAGGEGTASNIMGTVEIFGSGGGGGGDNNGGAGGTNAGRGGYFDDSNPCVAYAATAPVTGYGGGGAGAGTACGTGSTVYLSGTNGDKGTVRIRYPYLYKQLYIAT